MAFEIRNLWRAALAAGTAMALLAPAGAAFAQATEQFVALPSYRVGPYGANGQSFYGGFIDYLNYVNLKDGGVNGVKLSWEECETEYNNAKGVECYERLKAKNATTKGTAYHSMSTGISYALVDKTAADKVPLVMMGYGRTDAVDGTVFPYAFPLVTTYQMQVSAIVKYLQSKSGGSLAGKKIVYLYHDSAYGKEPIVALQAESKLNKFNLVEIPVAHPGNEQGAQWLRIRQENPDYVIFWGWGVMNQTALKAAQKVGFSRDKMIGSWWAGSEEDTVPAGDAAKGYMSATWNVAGRNVPLISDIDKVVYGASKGNMQDRNKVGSVLYNRGVSAAVVTVEAIRVAQDKFGKGKVMNGDQMRWAFENLNVTNARLQQLGATGLLPEIKTSCENHEGSGKVKIQQWDGSKWVVVSDWIEGNKALIHPLFKATAAQYAKEKGITPGCVKS
ncbi:ABC transporter substrate-binding protein [Cupriavidus plantarum]|uniref:Amino acid/amide ABC transporter substrate-binding protein (HAAT family) n=1 Tax=Cupriavidus plantarum TaxID=942865 RepID=A0A316FM16_9BURK|nr:ABC transporter substrate-binding protein [Cupriavidus plantarum]NYH97700.1 branched-chain amino acid transport system substrate-binding protein [Cupriavidus plantarum]PWK38700.1 amino acid/amide ABC transporter substrate-binding protein (HAAT family) [Cupriavidus plantarum]REE92330.1 amino acid/amide ABC transporter substrate-binding protein (HAAT family) [Cupriavidus plantarum]RLK35878.1 amino acid/amide ABC transporter substrate-binding protein (HAAT family) [Cupriavidus plantarum]CAG212